MKKVLFLIIPLVLYGLPSSWSQNVGVGTLLPAGKLHIKGSSNISQLIIDAHSAQSNTSPLFKLRNSLGNDLLWIHSDDSTNIFIGFKAGRVNMIANGATYNNFIGWKAGFSNTGGSWNTAIGSNALYTNTIGYDNIAIGQEALYSNTSGFTNTSTGKNSLRSNTTGWINTANGAHALRSNTTGYLNSSVGASSLYSNTTGFQNSAYGSNALYYNVAGSNATVIGFNAMQYANNTSTPFINYNVAVGFESLRGSTLVSTNTGNNNTALGYQTLRNNTSGSFNSSTGQGALFANTTGFNNTAMGHEALNTITTGNNNTAIGYGSDVSSVDIINATAIGSKAYVSASNSVVLGSINGINGATANVNVGIGVANPTARLHVNGTLKVVDGTQGAGKILTSDATGLASWQPPPLPPPTYYPSVTICCQSWMTKNLDVATYRNGDPIPKVTNDVAWGNLTTGAYCYYNNDSTMYAATYGKLYNWYAINDSRGLAPEGWHIPTDFEWTTLGSCLGGDDIAGGPIKEIGTTHWNTPNTGATNLSGFTGLPGGFRTYFGPYSGIVLYGYWWSSTESTTNYAWSRNLNYSDDDLDRAANLKILGFSVRCLRD